MSHLAVSMSRLTINSNIASLNAQRNLTQASKKLTGTFTRLASGLRINSAADDAAGLAISESLKADTRVFLRGIKNLNDGMGALNIADGALDELSGITVRLRELATQGANGTLSYKQRLALDQEAQSLAQEYNRIARSTAYNGRTLFDAGFGGLSLAAGGGRETLIESGLGGGIGDGTFLAPLSLSAGTGTNSVVIRDFNQDGHEDFISGDGGAIRVFLGRGDGTFGTSTSYVLVNNVLALQAVDVNNDRVLDLISAEYSNYAQVVLGNGDGTFKASRLYSAGYFPGDVDYGDFNADGNIDLVTSAALGNSVNIVFGNGDGTFRASQSYGVGGISLVVEANDFNQDGVSDLVYGSGADLYVALGQASGVLSTARNLGLIGTPRDATSGDLNNDGFLDLIIGDESPHGLYYLLGNGDGTFRASVSFGLSYEAFSVTLADLNGDGKVDLVAAGESQNVTGIFLGNGDGSFRAPYSYATGSNVQRSAVGDLNEDGVMDIVSVAYTSNQAFVLLGNSYDGVSAMQPFSLRSRTEALDAIGYFESALQRLGRQRGRIGAYQSRIGFATNTLDTAALNYNDATSRIVDTDVAEDSARLVAARILQQSNIAVLSQANFQPQLALRLLE